MKLYEINKHPFLIKKKAIRDCFSFSHHSQNVFLQWIVDMYERIEDTVGIPFYLKKSNESKI